MTPQQQQRRAAQKLGVTVEKARQLFSEPDAPQPRRTPTPQQQQSMRKAQEAMDHYGLEENDIFITPDEIFEVIGKHLGISVEQAKAIWDPCPAPRDDGTFAPDGRTIPWAELTYCNPPFSQWSDWYIKAVAEVKMGKRVIFLMSQLSYFKSGQEKTGILLRGHEEIAIKLISWCDGLGDGSVGFVHHPKWGPNEITGEKTGGPPLGVVLLDMAPRS